MFWTMFWLAFVWQMVSFVADRAPIFRPSTFMMIGYLFGAIWVALLI